MNAKSPVYIYQQAWSVEPVRDVYYALIGVIDSETTLAHVTPSHRLVILQPLELVTILGPEIPLEPAEPSHKYKAKGSSITVHYDTFMGAFHEGQPNFEFIEMMAAEDIYQEAVTGVQQDTFKLGITAMSAQREIHNAMLHPLGWYLNRRTKQVVRFLGVATTRTDPVAVVQDPQRGSLDPVILRPVQGFDPLTDDGRPDIWNGLQIIPLSEFTSTYWINDYERQTCYQYLGQDYKEVPAYYADDTTEVL